jgi:sugar lactone lactonase YvrE
VLPTHFAAAGRRRRLGLTALVAAVAVLAALPGTAFAGGSSGRISGTVPRQGLNVVLMAATPGAKAPVRLGSARSAKDGSFAFRYRGNKAASIKYLLATRPGGGAEAGFPVPGQTYRLAAALGEGAVPPRVKVTERTTVAMGFAMAQFIGAGDRVSGKNPGLRNAADMSGDLVDLEGGLSKVLRKFPNGGSTSTLPTFNSLANLLTICRRQEVGCARLLDKARTPGGTPAADTLAAVVNVARYPWHDTRGLYELSLGGHPRGHWQPSLGQGEAPDAWTLALRFEGDPRVLDGPGNFAIDAEGNLWVANNYAYSRKSRQPACGSERLARFTPTGQTYPGSPYEGGGLSGVGFGLTFDLTGRLWVANFGFEGKGCTKEADHYTASLFSPSGKTLSPSTGWEVGGISWPQGAVSDQQGNIWFANCGNDSVTKLDSESLTEAMIARGEMPSAVNFGGSAITAGSEVAFSRPFGAAVDAQGDVFVTGNGSGSVAKLGPNGEVLSLVSGGGLHLPLGVVADSNGYAWVSNSRWVVAPCTNKVPAKEAEAAAGKGGGTVTLIKPNGQIASKQPIKSGVVNPWGITVDGDDNVWVANFSGQRLTELCGSETQNCPPGKRKMGAPISPEKTGYGFDGLVRNTGVVVDPAGNVWLANNWKKVPIQTNPGAYQIVAYLGLATPVKSPQVGPPQRP